MAPSLSLWALLEGVCWALGLVFLALLVLNFAMPPAPRVTHDQLVGVRLTTGIVAALFLSVGAAASWKNARGA